MWMSLTWCFVCFATCLHRLFTWANIACDGTWACAACTTTALAASLSKPPIEPGGSSGVAGREVFPGALYLGSCTRRRSARHLLDGLVCLILSKPLFFITEKKVWGSGRRFFGKANSLVEK